MSRGRANDFSKTLSYWLRHRPDAAGIELDGAGWTEVAAVIEALGRAGLPNRLEDLQALVASSDKQRFELSPGLARIRARQGHSVAVELDWPLTNPPEFLFHGTVERFLPAIMAQGLKPMKRHHVHLSPDLATARAVGGRRGAPVILQVAVARMAADGHLFRLTSNQVWLTDRVPPQFLTLLEGEGDARPAGA